MTFQPLLIPVEEKQAFLGLEDSALLVDTIYRLCRWEATLIPSLLARRPASEQPFSVN